MLCSTVLEFTGNPAYPTRSYSSMRSTAHLGTRSAAVVPTDPTLTPADVLRWDTKFLGVARRLAQQLDLRFGPVEAHGPVNPDRLVPGIGDNHQGPNPGYVSPSAPAWCTSVLVLLRWNWMRPDRLEAGLHAIAVGVEAQAGAQPPVEERAEPRPMRFVRQPAPRPPASLATELRPVARSFVYCRVRGRLEVPVTVQPAHLGVGVWAGRQTSRG